MRALPAIMAAALWAALALGPELPGLPGLAGGAEAQDGAWRPLTVANVQAELEWRLARGASYATLWNAGYDIYRLHYRNQDTAMTIHRGYMALTGQRLEPEQRRAIIQAAIYWQKVHDYGVTNVPVGVDPNNRGAIWYGSEPYATTLRMRRPRGGPVPLRDGDRAPSRGSRTRTNHKGRVERPYPDQW